MGGTGTGRLEIVKATNQGKNKYKFNLSLKKQYLNCGKNHMMDISGGSICSISDLKPRQKATLIFVQGSYK